MVVRKTSEEEQQPVSNADKGSPESDNVRERIVQLENEFHADNLKNINNLVDLIDYITPQQKHAPKAIHAARRLLKTHQSTPVKSLQQWLSARRSQYTDALVAIITTSTDPPSIEAAVVAAALTHSDVWRGLLHAAIPSTSQSVITLVHNFVARFDDLRLTALELVTEGVASVEARLKLLSKSSQPAGDVARDKTPAKELRKVFTNAWLAVLRDNLSTDTKRQVLHRLPKELIPSMHDPLRLADFLTSCYNDASDVSVAISALDGLFVLISKHGLDYPLFYPKLYALMTDQALFYAEYREQFLSLCAVFLLKGGMLPGGLVAAFVKKLLRRAITAPAYGAPWCLRLALDLLYRHPNISYLVHHSVNLFDAGSSVGSKRKRPDNSDPFDDRELDPQASHADESSLWELQLLANHVSPTVSRLVTAFSKDVRKNPAPPAGHLSDYVGIDFEDVMQAEMKRKAKSYHLSYDPPGEAPGHAQLHERLRAGISWT